MAEIHRPYKELLDERDYWRDYAMRLKKKNTELYRELAQAESAYEQLFELVENQDVNLFGFTANPHYRKNQTDLLENSGGGDD